MGHVRGTGGRILGGVLASLSLAGAARADFSTIQALAASVYERTGICAGRTQQTANGVQIRAKRLTALMGDAEALYSSAYNKVLVRRDLFDDEGRLLDVAGLARAEGQLYQAYGAVSTIYHEMGHAEWDILIEEEFEPGDRTFYEVVTDQIVPWIEDNETEVDDAWLAVQEWHGYYVGRMVGRLLGDAHDLLFFNGLDPATFEVDENMVRGSLRSGSVRPEDFGSLTHRALPEGRHETYDRSYEARARGYTVYVSNGLIDGQVSFETSRWTPANGFRDEWWQAIWDHVRHQYCVPESWRGLTRRLEVRLEERLRELRAARERIARELRDAASGEALGQQGR